MISTDKSSLSTIRNDKSGESQTNIRLGVFDSGWWSAATDALRIEKIQLPSCTHSSGNTHLADSAERLTKGRELVNSLANHPVNLLVDNAGGGLGFVFEPNDPENLRLAHEAVGAPLLSHIIDPLVTTFQGLPWEILWQSLHSPTWVKAVWDRAQAVELQRFGIPNVIHLPMAAPNRAYDTSPIDPKTCRKVASFVGGQNTTYFSSNAAVPSSTLLPGVLSHAVRADLRDITFVEAYQNVYGMGDAFAPSESQSQAANRAAQYFQAKLFYNAIQCIRQRDRFVIFLSRALGDVFELIGGGWKEAYGLPASPPISTLDAYLRHFREVAINLNFINGNAETGLNMRAFEITAAGGFMLCREHPELGDYFAIGKECATFVHESDLLEKIRYYLDHDDERAEIARAGQIRTLSQHLYSHRLSGILKAGFGRRSPAIAFSTSTWQMDCKRIVPEARVILDCGANVGQMAEGFRKAYPRATIYSFEPVSKLHRALAECCGRVGARWVPKAVGDRDGTAEIQLTTSPEANSLFDHQPGNPCAKWTQVIDRETIQVCTLDRWCKEEHIAPRSVDLIKLDVQGAELKALYGARGLLRHAPLVLVEVSFVPIYKDAPLFPEIDAFMNESGFVRYAMYPSDQPSNWGDALYVRREALPK
ncbi:MAG: FkbM family methyltransferase [Planctomycetes bacterium]|nr:FkbM family methyltransferase [Planctomycetota bacterium]MBI3835608.1 FkbM family methyltransferase [Planctomycetota bacterium]